MKSVMNRTRNGLVALILAAGLAWALNSAGAAAENKTQEDVQVHVWSTSDANTGGPHSISTGRTKRRNPTEGFRAFNKATSGTFGGGMGSHGPVQVHVMGQDGVTTGATFATRTMTSHSGPDGKNVVTIRSFKTGDKEPRVVTYTTSGTVDMTLRGPSTITTNPNAFTPGMSGMPPTVPKIEFKNGVMTIDGVQTPIANWPPPGHLIDLSPVAPMATVRMQSIDPKLREFIDRELPGYLSRHQKQMKSEPRMALLKRQRLTDLMAMREGNPARFQQELGVFKQELEIDKLEQAARETGNSIQQSADGGEKQLLRTKLRGQLEQVFELRAQHREAEAKAIERELEEIRALNARRIEYRKQIIERRLLELTGEKELLEW